MIAPIIFPDMAITGDTVDSQNYTWVKEDDGQWTRIINSTAFAQSLIVSVKSDLVALPMIAADINNVSKNYLIGASPYIAANTYTLTYVK